MVDYKSKFISGKLKSGQKYFVKFLNNGHIEVMEFYRVKLKNGEKWWGLKNQLFTFINKDNLEGIDILSPCDPGEIEKLNNTICELSFREKIYKDDIKRLNSLLAKYELKNLEWENIKKDNEKMESYIFKSAGVIQKLEHDLDFSKKIIKKYEKKLSKLEKILKTA